jgi:hypothetical protein
MYRSSNPSRHSRSGPASSQCRRSERFPVSYAIGLALLASLALAGCGCDGSGSAEFRGGTGSATLFLTDAPSDDFDRILVTIESIQFLGDGGKITIFEGRETIDLKDLEDFSDLFVYAEDIPVGKFEKIRLRVSRVLLVKEGPDREVIDVKVPANGKIDLLPDSSFYVRKDVNLVIEIDMDANKAIHIIETGNHRYKLRPVIKVTIEDTRPPRKLARVHGEITESFDDQNFELCSTVFMASRDSEEYDDDSDHPEDGGMGDRHRCMTAELDDATGIFDSEGDPTDASELMVGDEVTVVGRFHLVDANHDDDDDDAEVQPVPRGTASYEDYAADLGDFEHREHFAHARSSSRDDDDGDDDYDDKDEYKDRDRDDDDDEHDQPRAVLVLLAYVVEMGAPGTFDELRGIALSEVDDMDLFDFEIGSRDRLEPEDVVAALLQMGTRIFARDGFELDAADILPDTRARIDGVFSEVDSEVDEEPLLKTALIVLDLGADRLDVLRGEITMIDEEQRELLLEVNDDGATGEECVSVRDETEILILGESDDGMSSESGSFEDLMVGWTVRADGVFGEDDCLVAKKILASPEDPDALSCGRNDHCADGNFCNKPKGACATEGVCRPNPQDCLQVFDPVCGCDGVTYSNECSANAAGTSVVHDGACAGDTTECGGSSGAECETDQVCIVPDGSCDEDAEGVCQKAPEKCEDDFKPVCGCDGDTYGNRCLAADAGATVASAGRCENSNRCGGMFDLACDAGQICLFDDGVCDETAEGTCVKAPPECSDIYKPVCGCDGITYDNACIAAVKGAAVAQAGACDGPIVCGGGRVMECPDGQYCAAAPGTCEPDAEGICRPIPEVCPTDAPGVCGCDEKSYNNACEANREGVTVASSGLCEEPPRFCGGADLQICGADEICVWETGVCDAMADGICMKAPAECPGVVEPVCGCDGNSYANSCDAITALAAVQSEEACSPLKLCGGEGNTQLCDEGEMCFFQPDVCTSNVFGVCVREPEACPDHGEPVCSCDGEPYVNACEATKQGVPISQLEACATPL